MEKMEQTKQMITVSESALAKLREMQEDQPSKGGFRLVLKGFG